MSPKDGIMPGYIIAPLFIGLFGSVSGMFESILAHQVAFLMKTLLITDKMRDRVHWFSVIIAMIIVPLAGISCLEASRLNL